MTDSDSILKGSDMHIPPSPPDLSEIIQSANLTWIHRMGDRDVIEFIRSSNEAYVHWNKFRYYKHLPNGFDTKLGWAAIALSRIQQYQALPIRFHGSHLVYWSPPQQLEWLHKIDQQAGGALGSNSVHVASDDSDKYLINALMEEAIASSQLEGAVTTRRVAKQMLREGRKPNSKAERMIFNNYRAILRIRDCQHDSLSPELLRELHSILTDGTFEDSSGEGHFRESQDDVVVEDSYSHDVLHSLPSAESLEGCIEEICDFANQRSRPFVHPVTKAIILHFAIGYVHPFVDGNGRTARAVFYWYMLKHGYWLFEYLPISRLFLLAPAKYARSYLYTETDRGDVTYFIHYNLKVILRAMKDLHSYLAKQQKKISEAAKLLSNSSDLNHRQQSLIYHALKHSDALYTIQQHKGTYHVSYGTARSDLTKLAEAGYLELARQKNKMLFYPHGELLRKLKKASASIAKPLPQSRPRLPPLAVTRVRTNDAQTAQQPLFAPRDDEVPFSG
jgi:Fic family protein